MHRRPCSPENRRCRAESDIGFAALTAVVHHLGTDTIGAVIRGSGRRSKSRLRVREAQIPDARLLGEAILAALNTAAGDANLLVIIDDLQARTPRAPSY